MPKIHTRKVSKKGAGELLDTAFETFISALVWFGVWYFGFVVLAEVSLLFAFPIETTGFLVSVTILLGHLPKLVAILINTDTDFQGVLKALGKVTFRKLRWIRLILASIPVAILCVVLIPSADDIVLRSSFNPLHVNEFLEVTWQNMQICLALFATQYIFSWPIDSIVVEERELVHFSNN